MSEDTHRPDYGQMLASISVPVLLISPDHCIDYANDASGASAGLKASGSTKPSSLQASG
jgi:hypothetical protein